MIGVASARPPPRLEGCWSSPVLHGARARRQPPRRRDSARVRRGSERLAPASESRECSGGAAARGCGVPAGKAAVRRGGAGGLVGGGGREAEVACEAAAAPAGVPGAAGVVAG